MRILLIPLVLMVAVMVAMLLMATRSHSAGVVAPEAQGQFIHDGDESPGNRTA
jgi:hypothetical protein